MYFCSTFLILILLIKIVISDVSIRVMTFNIWKNGSQVENGLAKIVKHIKFINPDIVAIQVRGWLLLFIRQDWVSAFLVCISRAITG
jgi:hypothetical protein